MLCKLFKRKIIIEKLLIIIFIDNGKCFIEREKLICVMGV